MFFPSLSTIFIFQKENDLPKHRRKIAIWLRGKRKDIELEGGEKLRENFSTNEAEREEGGGGGGWVLGVGCKDNPHHKNFEISPSLSLWENIGGWCSLYWYTFQQYQSFTKDQTMVRQINFSFHPSSFSFYFLHFYFLARCNGTLLTFYKQYIFPFAASANWICKLIIRGKHCAHW